MYDSSTVYMYLVHTHREKAEYVRTLSENDFSLDATESSQLVRVLSVSEEER